MLGVFRRIWVMSWSNGIRVTNSTVAAMYPHFAAPKILDDLLRPRCSFPLRITMGARTLGSRCFYIPSPIGVGHNMALIGAGVFSHGNLQIAVITESKCKALTATDAQHPWYEFIEEHLWSGDNEPDQVCPRSQSHCLGEMRVRPYQGSTLHAV